MHFKSFFSNENQSNPSIGYFFFFEGAELLFVVFFAGYDFESIFFSKNVPNFSQLSLLDYLGKRYVGPFLFNCHSFTLV